MRRHHLLATVTPLLAAGLLAASPGPAAAATTPTRPGPGSFSTTIDNPYLPFVPGTVMRYRSTSADGPGTEVVTVTHRTRTVDGVTVVVVRDVARLRGSVVERTWDWYAQDRTGNVWYFGEASRTVKNGRVVSRAGSWQSGRHGARAGIVMEAHPTVGDDYAQEFRPGVAEDRATVLSRHATATVPAGTYRNAVQTKDYSPLEPGVVEHKVYARGVGSVLEKVVKGPRERLALVSVTHR